MSHRVGGGVTSPVLSHHRAYGSVPRRFMIGSEAEPSYPASLPETDGQTPFSGAPHSCEVRRCSTKAHDHSLHSSEPVALVDPTASGSALVCELASIAATGSGGACVLANHPVLPPGVSRPSGGSSSPSLLAPDSGAGWSSPVTAPAIASAAVAVSS